MGVGHSALVYMRVGRHASTSTSLCVDTNMKYYYICLNRVC